ncbi:MAG: DUF488 family protein, N3 subclade [Gaiellaceae bacterium]
MAACRGSQPRSECTSGRSRRGSTPCETRASRRCSTFASGVRGSRYAWANSVRLQAALAGARIEYRHHRELAPTTELRQLQHREDARRGVGKRSRVELAADYRRRYLREILGQVALRPIVEAMPVDGAAALLCVEADPEACHRSLVAERLEAEFGLPVEHLTPPGYARMRSLDGS